MLIWQPKENTELRRLYELCRQMGAPHFLSAAEMQEWLHQHLESFRFSALNAVGVISAFEEAGIKIFNALRKALRSLAGERLRAALREQLKRQHAVKALRKPLQIIPKSLHPDVSLAR